MRNSAPYRARRSRVIASDTSGSSSRISHDPDVAGASPSASGWFCRDCNPLHQPTRKASDDNRRDRAIPSPHRCEDVADRQVVAGPADDLRRLQLVRRLRDRAGVLGHQLLLGAVPLAVLLAVPRRLRRGLVGLRPAVRRVPAVGRADHPDLPAGLPDDLLLLPQGVLPGVLAVAAGLRRRRAAREVLRRDPVPADPAEHPPLLLVRRGGGRADPQLRRDPGVRSGRGGVRRHPHGPRHRPDVDQRLLHLAVHAVLPLLPAHGRRPAAALLQAPGPLPALDLGLEAQRQARPLRLGLPVLRGAGRPLHLPARRQRLRRPEVLLDNV